MQNIISYSQNYEDVVLWRVFKNIKNGFYIDIGACDPIKDSDTKLLYDNGWTGINIEPELRYHNKLKEMRPKDINLNIAIDKAKGNKILYVSEKRGWSTLDYSRTKNKNFNQTEQINVKCLSLNDLFDEYCKEKKINFLKIDVEGNELNILNSFDFNKHNPEVIMIEELLEDSFNLNKKIRLTEILTNNDYYKCQFNGINSIYISNKTNYDKSLLTTPANVLDKFDDFKKLELLEKIEKLKNENLELEENNKKSFFDFFLKKK